MSKAAEEQVEPGSQTGPCVFMGAHLIFEEDLCFGGHLRKAHNKFLCSNHITSH